MNAYDIASEEDIIRTRRAARQYAEELRFSALDKTRIATSVSELARNTLLHGGGGRMEMHLAENGSAIGIRCVFIDQGPGISDTRRAVEDGVPAGGNPGQGLPGVKRLMDDFAITSTIGKGTRVEIVKWK
ncbi:MAG: anti-sigma regulatory factor [Alphaproteobacteria bacterium]|nr:anti-sigma regulatory factor [Alphaproteobacteria bacterium]